MVRCAGRRMSSFLPFDITKICIENGLLSRTLSYSVVLLFTVQLLLFMLILIYLIACCSHE